MLSKPAASAERPATLPAGTYIGVQVGFKYTEANFERDGTKPLVVRFSYRLQAPGDDVQPELLAGIKDLQQRIVTRDFEVAEDKQWILRQYLESVAPERVAAGASFHELIESETNGKAYLLEITATPGKGKNEGQTFNNVGKVSAYKG